MRKAEAKKTKLDKEQVTQVTFGAHGGVVTFVSSSHMNHQSPKTMTKWPNSSGAGGGGIAREVRGNMTANTRMFSQRFSTYIGKRPLRKLLHHSKDRKTKSTARRWIVDSNRSRQMTTIYQSKTHSQV